MFRKQNVIKKIAHRKYVMDTISLSHVFGSNSVSFSYIVLHVGVVVVRSQSNTLQAQLIAQDLCLDLQTSTWLVCQHNNIEVRKLTYYNPTFNLKEITG